jgi:hypothetical protein
MKTPTLKEAQSDLQQTVRDIEYLAAIIIYLTAFINNDPCRSHFKIEAMRYETQLKTAKRLKKKIEEVISSLS